MSDLFHPSISRMYKMHRPLYAQRRAGVLVTVYTANISLSLGTVGYRWYTTGRIGLQAMCNVNLNESYSLDSRFSLENYLFHDGIKHFLSLPISNCPLAGHDWAVAPQQWQ